MRRLTTLAARYTTVAKRAMRTLALGVLWIVVVGVFLQATFGFGLYADPADGLMGVVLSALVVGIIVLAARG